MIRIILISVLLSIFSASIMMYIALATSIGPWISPLLVLMSPLIFRILFLSATTENRLLVVITSSIGGILSTACAFSLPAFFFIDSSLYNQWLASPFIFIAGVGSFCLLASLYGLVIGRFLMYECAEVSTAKFPAGQLVFTMINVQDACAQLRLFVGIVTYALFVIARSAILFFMHQSTYVFRMIFVCCSAASITILPMLLSIGFITGHVIVFPLFVGLMIKVVCVICMRPYFGPISQMDFSLALCGGIILMSLLINMIKVGSNFYSNLNFVVRYDLRNVWLHWCVLMRRYHLTYIIFASLICGLITNTSLFFVLYVMTATMWATYLMVVLAAQTGLAYLGRFATFVMLPLMISGHCNPLLLILVSALVEITGGIAVDIATGYKIIDMATLDRKKFVLFQLLGIVVASFTSAVVLWGLSSFVVLGSPALVAYKAHSRALLLQLTGFDTSVMMLGLCIGCLCHLLKINTATILGGILMPFETSIGLICGGCLAHLTKFKDWWYPICAGVFAANSLYMIVQAVLA